MECSQGENPECYIDNSITYSGILRKTERLANRQTLLEECRAILQRPFEGRTAADNQTLLQLVEKNEMLKELVELYGLDFVKGLLRNAKMEFVDEGQVIAEEQQDVKCIVLLLEGRIGVERAADALPDHAAAPLQQQQEALENLALRTEALFDRLTLLARKERELQRRTLKLKRKSTLPTSDYKFLLPVLSRHDYARAGENLLRTVLAGEEFGGKERLSGRLFRNRAVALEKSALFIVELSFLFYWLEVAFRAKLAKNVERMKAIPAFETVRLPLCSWRTRSWARSSRACGWCGAARTAACTARATPPRRSTYWWRGSSR